MNTEEKIKRSRDAVEEIKRSMEHWDSLMHLMIQPYVNLTTGKTLGHVVVMQLNPNYYYFEKDIMRWKEILGANEWNIHIWSNTLSIRFFIHYEVK